VKTTPTALCPFSAPASIRTTYPFNLIDECDPSSPGVSIVTCNSDCSWGMFCSEIKAPCKEISRTGLAPLSPSSDSQEGIDVHASFAQDCAQRAFGHISCVVRDRDFLPGFLMPPYFVAARSGAIKSKTKYAKSPHDLAVGKSC